MVAVCMQSTRESTSESPSHATSRPCAARKIMFAAQRGGTPSKLGSNIVALRSLIRLSRLFLQVAKEQAKAAAAEQVNACNFMCTWRTCLWMLQLACVSQQCLLLICPQPQTKPFPTRTDTIHVFRSSHRWLIIHHFGL